MRHNSMFIAHKTEDKWSFMDKFESITIPRFVTDLETDISERPKVNKPGKKMDTVILGDGTKSTFQLTSSTFGLLKVVQNTNLH